MSGPSLVSNSWRLEPGAPVELNGIVIGEVTDIRAQFDAKTYQFSAPVTIRVDPARLGVKILNNIAPNSPAFIAAHQKVMDTLVAHGLRAQLQTGSLVTGAKYVAFQFFSNAAPVTLDWSQTPVVLPTIQRQLESLTTSLASLRKSIQQIPFKNIGNNLSSTISDVRQAAQDLDAVLLQLHQYPSGFLFGQPPPPAKGIKTPSK